MAAFLRPLGYRINSAVWEPCDETTGCGSRLTRRYVVNGHGIAGIGLRDGSGLIQSWMWHSMPGGGGGCWIGSFPTEIEAVAAVVGAVSLAARHWFACSRCGIYEDPLMWDNGAELRKAERCTRCAFWEKWQTAAKSDPNYFVAEGRAYTVGKEPSPDRLRSYSSCYGFGGAEIRVRFNDGRTVVTHNLWHQGLVPERFREEMPDTAEFLRGGQTPAFTSAATA